MSDQAHTEFLRRYQGRLHGVLRWPQWRQLCDTLLSDGDWYVYDLAGPVPAAPCRGQALAGALQAIDTILRREHAADYFGLAYADDVASPSLVKIYHPRRMGSVCGSSGQATPPAWVISREQPCDLTPPPPDSGGWRAWLSALRT